MDVNVYEQDTTTLVQANADYRDYVPEHEQADARHNLERYGRYWLYALDRTLYLQRQR